jgi:serine protease
MSVPSGKTQISLNVLAAAMLLAMAPALTAEAADFRFADKPIDGQYIVVLKSDAASLANEQSSRPQVATVANEMARTHRADLVRSYDQALRGFVVKASDNALARLLADPRVEYVEEDGIVEAWATQSGATWGIDRTDQRNLPLSGTYTYDTTASSVHAYIIDTGILASHSDFGGRVSGGYTAISDGNGTSDCNGHGTHVAGTVGGATWGIAKAVKLHPVRVLSCSGSGSNSGVIAGVDWVTSNHVKPAVANMSLGGGASSALDTAVSNSINAGVTYAVAAGNDNANACNYSPARVGAALTAASSTSSDARSSFSNYGSCIDLFAPGSSIKSAWYTSTSATNTISGTSMASPHIAGVAALYLAVNPTSSASQGHQRRAGLAQPPAVLVLRQRATAAAAGQHAHQGRGGDQPLGQHRQFAELHAGGAVRFVEPVVQHLGRERRRRHVRQVRQCPDRYLVRLPPLLEWQCRDLHVRHARRGHLVRAAEGVLELLRRKPGW